MSWDIAMCGDEEIPNEYILLLISQLTIQWVYIDMNIYILIYVYIEAKSTDSLPHSFLRPYSFFSLLTNTLFLSVSVRYLQHEVIKNCCHCGHSIKIYRKKEHWWNFVYFWEVQRVLKERKPKKWTGNGFSFYVFFLFELLNNAHKNTNLCVWVFRALGMYVCTLYLLIVLGLFFLLQNFLLNLGDLVNWNRLANKKIKKETMLVNRSMFKP